MSDDILFEERNDVGLITLNRPEKLNALTLQMCKTLDEKLIQWEADDNINIVIIRGAGERAFCAGGDITGIYHNGPENIDESIEFFRTEYAMNARVFHFTKPYIALLHGITMGGGLGVSIHGKACVADPGLVMAMPETGIGFFPDVGGSYFLSRLPGEIGTYLGLTGARISAADAKFCGLILNVIKHEHFDLLIDRMVTDRPLFPTGVLDGLSVPTEPSQLEENTPIINQCFGFDQVDEIFSALEKNKSEFATKTLAMLNEKSPTSLKITLKELRDARSLQFDECMQMENRIVEQILTSPDFYEGVRAAVIDKDNNPKWS